MLHTTTHRHPLHRALRYALAPALLAWVMLGLGVQRACAEDRITAACLSAFLAATTFDTITTGMVVHAGGEERNPLMQGWRFPVFKAATSASTTAWALKNTKAHKTLVRVVLITGGAFYAGIAAHNYSVYQTQVRR